MLVKPSIAQRLHQYPFLNAHCLRVRNQWRRIAERPFWLALLILAAASVFAVLLWFIPRLPADALNTSLHALDEHGAWVFIVAALHGAVLVAQRKRTKRLALTQSWLSTTPRAAATLRTSIIFCVLWAPVWRLLVVEGVLLLLWVGQADSQRVFKVMGLVLAGCSVGTAAGLLVPSERSGVQGGSRYMPKLGKGEGEKSVNLTALSHWPIAHVFASMPPDKLRWPLAAAMLSVTAGSSALGGIAVVALWMLTLYLTTLVSATVRVVHESARWLSTTPITALRFARVVLTRSVAHQLIAALVLIGLAMVTGMDVAIASRLLLYWMGLVMVVYIAATAYSSQRHLGAARRGVSESLWSIR